MAQSLRFPGSPTVRVDGIDVEPGFANPGDYTLPCRIYRSNAGAGGVPERAWIETAIERAGRG